MTTPISDYRLDLLGTLPIGDLTLTPSPKLVLHDAGRDVVAVYDGKPGCLRLYQGHSLTKTKETWIDTRLVSSMGICPDGVIGDLVTASPAGLHSWRDALNDRATGPPRIQRHVRMSALPTSLAWVQQRLFVGTVVGTLLAYDLERRRPLIQARDAHVGGRLNQLLPLGSGHILASAGVDASVRLWDTNRFAPIATITLDDDGGASVRTLAYASRRKLLVSGGASRALSFWTMDGRLVQTVQDAHTAPIVSCRFRERTPYLHSLDEDGMMQIWDCRSFKTVQSIATTIATGSVTTLADDRLLVVGAHWSASVYGPGGRPADRRPIRTATRTGPLLYCAESDRVVLGVGRGIAMCTIDNGLSTGHSVVRCPDLCSGSITALGLKLTNPTATILAGDERGFAYLIDANRGRLFQRLPARHERSAIDALHYDDAHDRLYTMAIGRQSVCVLEHELGAPSQARRLRFALSAPIVALSVTGAPFRAAIVSGSGPGALIDPIGGRSDRLDFGSGHGNKPIACVQIAADQHLVISVDVSGLICIWSWDDPDRPALVIASSPIADRVKGSGAVLLTAYSPATGILAVAYSAQGLIDCLQLRSMSAAAGSVSYRRLGRITTRTAPIRALTLAERRLGQIGVTVVARSPWQVELYSTEADFLGCFSEHQDGGCAADRNRMTPIPVPNTGSDALLDLVIAPTLSAYRLRAKTRLAVERSQRIPGMGGPNALPIQPLPDVAAHAIDCSKLSPSRLDRGRRLQGSASEIALASPSWKKTTVDAALLPFLSISKAGAVSDVSSSPPGPVVHSETNESGNGHDTRQTGGVPIIARRIAVDVRINLPKADPHDFLNIGHSRGSGW